MYENAAMRLQPPLFSYSAVAGKAVGPCGSVAAANSAFVSEWGPTRWNLAPARDGKKDSGPASAVIAVSALAPAEHPDGWKAGGAIMGMRELMHPGSSTSAETSDQQLVRGLVSDGYHATSVPPTLEQIQASLHAGHPIVLSGVAHNAWGKHLAAADQYLTQDGGKKQTWVTVLGIDAHGHFIVADPLSKKGAIAVTGAQLNRFIGDGQGKSRAVAVSA